MTLLVRLHLPSAAQTTDAVKKTSPSWTVSPPPRLLCVRSLFFSQRSSASTRVTWVGCCWSKKGFQVKDMCNPRGNRTPDPGSVIARGTLRFCSQLKEKKCCCINVVLWGDVQGNLRPNATLHLTESFSPAAFFLFGFFLFLLIVSTWLSVNILWTTLIFTTWEVMHCSCGDVQLQWLVFSPTSCRWKCFTAQPGNNAKQIRILRIT